MYNELVKGGESVHDHGAFARMGTAIQNDNCSGWQNKQIITEGGESVRDHDASRNRWLLRFGMVTAPVGKQITFREKERFVFSLYRELALPLSK